MQRSFKYDFRGVDRLHTLDVTEPAQLQPLDVAEFNFSGMETLMYFHIYDAVSVFDSSNMTEASYLEN